MIRTTDSDLQDRVDGQQTAVGEGIVLIEHVDADSEQHEQQSEGTDTVDRQRVEHVDTVWLWLNNIDSCLSGCPIQFLSQDIMSYWFF